jgi:hypothetical protein
MCLHDGPYERAALQLRGDGSYALVEHRDPNDRSVFLAALVIAKWRLRHGEGS